MKSSKLVSGSVKSFWLLREIILKILLPNREILITPIATVPDYPKLVLD
jgi:hypothetical protein